MTEQSRHWDGTLLGDASYAPYSALKWAEQERLAHGQGASFPNYGILEGTGDGTYPPLRLQATSPASTNVELRPGAALVRGYFYENTAIMNLAVGANASGNPRIDTVILRVDFVAQTIRAAIKQGTPAGSPARPSLQQDTSIWEMPLADIAVANGFATITNANVTTRRRSVLSLTAGWQPIANPINYVPGGTYAAGFAFTTGFHAIAVPFTLAGNMLLSDVRLRHTLNNFNYTIEWGIYTQDVNDGNTSENTLRLVASGGGSGSATPGSNIAVPGSLVTQILSPGTYWLVLRGTGSDFLRIGVVAAGNFDEVGYRSTTAFPVAFGQIPQTLDMVTGWTTVADPIAVRLRGRVFGQSAVL